MSHVKPNFFWPLRLIAAFSLGAPALIFGYTAWQNHRAIDAQANERIERALDVLQEHALKAFQTVERSISEINEVLRGISDERLRASESDFFLRFKRTQQALPQIESIWAFDRDGHPLVSSTILPVPRILNNSDRSYFRAHKEADRGTYIGEVVRARVGSLSFFVVSARRRGDQAGRFEGVIGVTVMPEHFGEFYRKLTRGQDTFAMVRTDGTLLARFPEARLEGMATSATLMEAIRGNPEAGLYTATSKIDGIERRIGYRQVPDFPLYVVAGIETAALSKEFWRALATQLALGLPAALALFALALYSLRRARRFQEEATRRELAENALKQAQRLEAVGQLTGGVAHDFNNLLMVMSGNLERLKGHLSGEDRSRRAVAAMEVAVKRGTELTRQLLSFSRRQTHEAKTIDPKEHLLAIRETLQSSLRGDIAVDTDISTDVWPIMVDVSEFELSLLNLAVNGRDAMENGGSLSISAKNVVIADQAIDGLKGDFVAVSVTDTGAGIPSEILSHVFEPFFTTKDVDRGTGLGLSQVYGFAQQAGGAATIISEVGRGTTVTLYLPRSRQQVLVVPEARPNESARMPLPDQRKLLLVEDNTEVAHVTRSLLEEIGYSVSSVVNATSAMETLRKEKFDIVLTDIVMPGTNGLDLARWIRQEYNAEFPIILVTGYSSNAQEAAEESFVVLHKPYDIEKLRGALAEASRRVTERKDGISISKTSTQASGFSL